MRAPSERPGASGAWAALPLVAVAGAAALILLPVPTPVVDLLLALNLGTAVLLLLAALTAPNPRTLSALPGVLLLTTLFRLALNICTTRLILVQADAGGVVRAFGEFVVSGSYLVGGVVFAILTVVQFVVVASGAGRVAEVAARFALDALPGAQAAIDADLRGGALSQAEAERRRQDLQTESRLHGALDGAMRFVRGDAIAGLVITVVNLVGGVAVGATQRGLSTAEALHTYGLLTIGDGLAAQIPSVLVSVAAGLCVTRVDDPKAPGPLPYAAIAQLTHRPANLLGAGALLVVLGVLPGLPGGPFVVLGAATLLWGWHLGRRGGPGDGAAHGQRDRPVAARLIVRVGPDVAACLGGPDDVRRIAASAAADGALTLRWTVPAVDTTVDPGNGPDAWIVELDGAAVDRGVLDPSDPEAAAAGLRAALAASVRHLLPELVDLQTTSDLLDQLAFIHPALVREVVPARMPLAALAGVLRELLRDGLPAGDLHRVLEGVLRRPAPGGPQGPVWSAAAIRQQAGALRPEFRRWLTAAATDRRPHGEVEVHTLSEPLLMAVEDALEASTAIRSDGRTATAGTRSFEGSGELPRWLVEDLRAAASLVVPVAPTPRPVVVTPTHVRRAVALALGRAFAHVMVLTGDDLADDLQLEPGPVLRLPEGRP